MLMDSPTLLKEVVLVGQIVWMEEEPERGYEKTTASFNGQLWHKSERLLSKRTATLQLDPERTTGPS